MSLIVAASLLLTTPSAAPRTENVVIVMLDGLRWQEVFDGADASLLNKERGGVADVKATTTSFWREAEAERRAALLPFLWGTVAKVGQLFGNRRLNSVGRVTNTANVSYPGYSELLCGVVDPRITGNAKVYNRNVTVFEWLHRKPAFQNRVAAFGSWELFPYIFNAPRCGFPVNAGLASLAGLPDSEEVLLLNRLTAETTLWGEETRPDALTFHAARLYMAAKRPRLLYVSFDETDAMGHAGRYDRLLGAARKGDAYTRELWELVQSWPAYRGKTTLIVTTDHGRGGPPLEWKNHGAKTPGAEAWWLGILGPDTPPLGERRDHEPVGPHMVAATVAALLGFDYRADQPDAGPALPGVMAATP